MNCKIHLDRYHPIYYTGECIFITVSLNLSERRIIEAIDLIFYGKTEVEWWAMSKPPCIIHNDSSSRLDEWQIKFHGHQEHINYKTRLTDNTNIENNDGQYKYSCYIKLPFNLPSSSLQQHGKTIFKLRAEFICKKMATIIDERDIWIRNDMDLRLLRHLHVPILVHDCFDDYEFWFKMPCKCYTPGQRIPYQIAVFTNEKVQIAIALNHFIKYKCLQPISTNKILKKALMINFIKKSNKFLKSYLQIPLTSEISTTDSDYPEQDGRLMSFTYNVEIIVMNLTSKYTLKSYTMNLVIGTKPYYTPTDNDGEFGLINYGSAVVEDFVKEIRV